MTYLVHKRKEILFASAEVIMSDNHRLVQAEFDTSAEVEPTINDLLKSAFFLLFTMVVPKVGSEPISLSM